MFPKNFLWGVSLAGFQFEMGDPEGRAIDPNTDWFVWVHDESNIKRGIVSGDLPEKGIDYWHRFREDHDIAKSLGMNAYRLNLEWSRIFPRPTFNINIHVEKDESLLVNASLDEEDLAKLDELADKSAVQHYREVIMDLREKGFLVILNLVHFTLPIWLHDPIQARATNLKRGPLGYADPRFPIEFVKFAAYAAWRFGDLVDIWSTFNEPSVVAEAGFLFKNGKFPPGLFNFDGYRKTLVNIAQAHVLAYKIIKSIDKTKAYPETSSPAEVGIIHNMIPFHPLDPRRHLDVTAARFSDHLHNRWILNAVTRGWVDKDTNMKEEPSEMYAAYKDKVDWIGVNYYSRQVVHGKRNPLSFILGIPVFPEMVKGYGNECVPDSYSMAGRPTSNFGWEIYPEGLAEVLDIAAGYGKPIIVTENGIADREDRLRPHFIALHLKTLEEYIQEKNTVKGYLHWALVDNFEWADGFRMKFGLYAVDLESKKRIRRPSADVLAEIIREGYVPDKYVKEALKVIKPSRQ
ncbi:beta-galactosidase BgaS [Infirmifilum sp.]|uniref:beta-galactosidase BgaS n=1 Tax=Infirmifilum sp. TaxID=2856575 RepID=UPI003D0CEE7A